MATETVTPNIAGETASHASTNFVSENYTLEVGYTKAELAKPEADRKFKAYPEGAFSEEEIAAGEFQVVFSQTFVQYSPSNLQGVEELVPDDDEKVNLVAAQLKVKQVNRARSLVTSKDFKPVDGTIDQFDECNKKSERRLTQFEKTTKEIMEKFSPEMQKQLLALLQAQQQTA